MNKINSIDLHRCLKLGFKYKLGSGLIDIQFTLRDINAESDIVGFKMVLLEFLNELGVALVGEIVDDTDDVLQMDVNNNIIGSITFDLTMARLFIELINEIDYEIFSKIFNSVGLYENEQ